MLISLPPTKESAELKNKEQLNNYKLVFKENAKGQFDFIDLLHVEEAIIEGNELYNQLNAKDEHIVELTSLYAGILELDKGTIFSNVEKSTGDSKTGHKTWIELFRVLELHEKKEKLKDLDFVKCNAEENLIYIGNDQSDERTKKFKCCERMVGGHIILNERTSRELQPGADLHLLPICNTHNTFNYTGVQGEAGYGFYMKTTKPVLAIKLKDYCPEKQKDKK